MLSWLLAAALPAAASDEFLKALRKAERHDGADERLVFFTQAIAAWTPQHGNALLANCHYRRGEALWTLSRPADAEPDLSKAIALDPNNVRAYLLRGQARTAAARPREALPDLREYVGLKDDDAEGHLALGEALLKTGKPADAAQSFRRGADLAAEDPRGPLGEGQAFMALKDFRRARGALDEAEARGKGRFADAYTERAVCRVATGDHPGALEDYSLGIPILERELDEAGRGQTRKAVAGRAAARLARAHYGRGRLREFLTRLPEAAADYAAACELGHDAACKKASSLAAKAPKPAPKAKPARPEPEPEAPPKKRRRRWLPAPESDAGDRIYAN